MSDLQSNRNVDRKCIKSKIDYLIIIVLTTLFFIPFNELSFDYQNVIFNLKALDLKKALQGWGGGSTHPLRTNTQERGDAMGSNFLCIFTNIFWIFLV